MLQYLNSAFQLYCDYLRSLPLGQFLNLNVYLKDALKIDHKVPYFLFLKYEELYEQSPVEIKEATIINSPLLKIYPVYSAGIAIGYLFEIPRQQLKINTTYFTVRRHLCTQSLFENVKILLQTPHLMVLGHEINALAVCYKTEQPVVDIKNQ